VVHFWLACCFIQGKGLSGVSMKTAITIWNNRVAPVFDVSGKVLLYESDGERLCSERMILLPDAGAAVKVSCLVEAKANVLICGAISKEALLTATNAGIKVYPFIAGDVRDIIQACLDSRFTEGDFSMPGCALRAECSGRGKHGGRREQVTECTQHRTTKN